MSAHEASSKSLHVKWSHVSKENFRGKPIGYIISYYSVYLRNYVDVVNVVYTTNTTTLTNLTVYTMYVIDVSAVSSGGIGPAKTAKVRTGAEGT